jgi:Zn-dependent M16 (insulinase) family peptidase
MKLSISEVLSYLEENFKYATHEDRKRLAELLNVAFDSVTHEPVEDGPIDMLSEVQAQMQMVRMIRKQIIALGSKANPKDLQSLVSTSTSLFGMLTKYSNDIINQDRIKAIESAVVEAIKDLGPDVQGEYFRKLEELLGE